MGSSPNGRSTSTAPEQQIAGDSNSQQRHSEIQKDIHQWLRERRQDPANAAKIEKDREAWRIQTAELEARERNQKQGQGMVFPNIPYSPRADAPNFRGNVAESNQPTTPSAQGTQPETSRPRRFRPIRLANPRRLRFYKRS